MSQWPNAAPPRIGSAPNPGGAALGPCFVSSVTGAALPRREGHSNPGIPLDDAVRTERALPTGDGPDDEKRLRP